MAYEVREHAQTVLFACLTLFIGMHKDGDAAAAAEWNDDDIFVLHAPVLCTLSLT